MTTRADVDTTITAWAEELVAAARADGRVQGFADRQGEVDDLARRLAEVQAEYDAHLAAHAPTPPAVDPNLPVSYSDFDTARKHLRIPDGVQIVPWGDVARPGEMLGAVLDRLGANQLLGLPERDAPYLMDATDGFYASGVTGVTTSTGTQKVVSKAARWFSLVRANRGIVGLGPRAVVGIAPTTWRSPAQPRPTASGAVGRFYIRPDGSRVETVGAQEKLIECEHADAYFGNFTLAPVPDLGGIAFHGITLRGGTVERLAGTGAWRGFAGVPNGETGMVSFNRGRYRILGLHADGAGVGSSPLMVNSSPGGTIDHARFVGASAGMPTIWNSSGEHVWRDVDSIDTPSQGVNLEQCLDGFLFRWERGTNAPLRDGKGLHVGIDARGRATVELVDVTFGELAKRSGATMTPGTVHVQGYGSSKANRDKISISATKAGKALPVKLYT